MNTKPKKRATKRQVSAFMQISLNGYYCDPRGDMSFAHKPPHDVEWYEFVAGNASGGGLLLFGRQTYTFGYEAELWRMADALRGSMDTAEYQHVVLGLIFLRLRGTAQKARGRTHQGRRPRSPLVVPQDTLRCRNSLEHCRDNVPVKVFLLL
jgi:hypothetical protein